MTMMAFLHLQRVGEVKNSICQKNFFPIFGETNVRS